jgi:CRISPR-associated protein Cmr2
VEEAVTAHLLVIAVGPVQGFIAAARRTRDLWFGSYLLSEVSRAVAVAAAKHGKLIFPASIKARNVANVILVELAADADPAAIAATARKAAREQWRVRYADPVFTEYQSIIRREIWDDQVDDVVEFYAAWAPLANNYPETRDCAMRLLAGRKKCRDFLPARGKPGVPKSSLDGLRESVLKDPTIERWPAKFRAGLRIRQGEQLDVVGLVKRVAEGTKPYPSVSRVAADPWLRGRGARLGELIAACRELNSRLGFPVIRELNTETHPHYRIFPYEGTAVFRHRHHEFIQETELDPKDLRPLAEAMARLGEPNPYLAVIVADGDKMGETLSNLSNVKQHQEFSATLAEFADQAQGIVNRYHGVLVYAGGDDVLAFVPVDQCLDCARELHDRFSELLRGRGAHAGSKITLSVGVAIAHFLENLEDLREYGHAAEKDAKQPDRDGLAIHLHKRGGRPIRIRAKWTDARPSAEEWAKAPDTRLTGLAVLLYEGLIPNRLATDLNRMADVYAAWRGDPAEAIRQDVLRVIAAKQPQGGGSVRERLRPVLERVTDAAGLRQLAEELLIARQIASACSQAVSRGNGKDQ